MKSGFLARIFLLSLAGAVITLTGCGGSSSLAPVTLSSIAVTPATPTIAINGTQQFKATGTYSDASTKDLTASVTWSSDTISVATVSSTGMATAVAAGSANIIATSGSLHGQTAVTVPAAAPTLQSIAVTATSLAIAIDGTQQFTATGTYSDSSTKDLTASVTWSSDTMGVATVSASGLVAAVAAGSANIIATSGSVHGQAAITVPAPAPTLQSIAVTATSLTIAINGTQQFTATGTYSDSSTEDITASVTWSSDTTNVATVSASGLVTAVATGSANIIATSGSVHGQAAVTVPPSLQSIAVASTGSLTIAISGTQQFTATGTYSDSSTKDITGSVTWSSDTTSVATISASGLATAVAAGSANIIATSGTVHGQAAVVVPATVRTYSGSASVGDFLTITIDQSQSLISYVNTSNGQTGSATYTTDFNGNTTLNDPAGHLLSLSEVPGFGIVALMNNAGTTADQLALITSVTQQNINANSFDNLSLNVLEFRTKGGGVGVTSMAIDGSSNFSGTEYMPFNVLGSSQDGVANTGFNLLPSFSLSADTTSPSPNYLFLQMPEPPDSSGKNFIFGAPNGMFLVDSEDGSMIGLPKAASKDFNASWANTYNLTYYRKTNAYGPDGNSPEAGNIDWGVAKLTLDASGNLSLTDSEGNTMASGLLVPVADTASLYDGTTTGGPFTAGELGDPCYGLFTFTDANGDQTQQVFVAFTQGTVLLSSFSTATSYNPGDDYNYFYGVGLPQSSTSSATNTGNSSNQGGSSTASAPGAWNSLGSTVSPTAQRLYVGSSSNGDLLTFTIDPSAGTLYYYDVTNGNRNATNNSGVSAITYSWANGVSTVSDPNNNVLSVLELPDQALLVEMNNTGYNIPSSNPPDFVIAVPQMNLTGADFLSQSYNFIQMQNWNGDVEIGTAAIDANGNMTGDGYTPWLTLTGSSASSAFSNLDAITFPTGTYRQPWVATTDTQGAINRGAYLFGYPNSLIFLSTATEGTLVGVPKTTSAAFQGSEGGNPITGTYKVMFYRRAVTGINPESGPTTTWKGLPETDGASMGFATLTITSGGVATLWDQNVTNPNSSNSTWSATLTPVSTSNNPTLYGTGNDGKLTDPCDGLYTFSVTTGSGGSAGTSYAYLTFVPGTQPAVVLTTFTIPTLGSSTTNYQYRYGMGFWTSATQ